MWYKNCYRRHLLDMHLDDWDPDFLSKFDPEEYVGNLKKAKIQNAMLYYQSHVGLCYWPTKSGKMHNGLKGREDIVKRLTDLCHENNIKVVGYYSLNYNNWAHHEHPEWRMLNPNGLSSFEITGGHEEEFSSAAVCRYGFCCPNNPDYREFVREQIKEMVEYFDADGLFYDMPFWPHKCYCEHCRKRWAEEVGGELPMGDDNIIIHNRKRTQWMGEFTQMVTDYTKSLNPKLTVEHNVASMALDGARGCGEAVNEGCDYAGGDLYRGISGHTFTCKLYQNLTKNRPFEYMFTRCENLRQHTAIKSVDEMLCSTFITTAHHGASLFIDAINIDGSMNGKVYDRLSGVFEKAIPYDKYMDYGEMVEDIGLYYTHKGKGCTPEPVNTNHQGVINTMDNLIESNISCGITGSYHNINKYDILVAPMLTSEDEVDNQLIIDYVKNGGKLYFSGGYNEGLIREFFGAEVERFTDENIVYVAPSGDMTDCFEYFDAVTPLYYDGCVPVLKGLDGKYVRATLTMTRTNPKEQRFASIHSNPPYFKTDMPAMAVCDYGKGKVVWSAAPFECVEHYDYHNIFRNILNHYFEPKLTVTSDAPVDVETVSFAAEDGMLISNVLLSNKYKAPTMPAFEMTVATDKAPVSVELLPDGQKIDFTYSDGKVKFTTRELNIFDMYKINF